MVWLQQWKSGFLHLFFPRTCQACGNVLFRQEDVICTRCLYNLPRTNFWKYQNNPVAEVFWGRVELHAAASYLFFNKGSKVQRLMHGLKYRGKKEVGIYLGNLMGMELKKSDGFRDVDVVVPVPLHPKKKLKRGYNQSALIAEGIAKSMKIEYQTENLIKIAHTESQTHKSRYDRWLNVQKVFHVQYPGHLENKHILLVDDVITTGATIEACAHVLKAIKGTKVSVASLAYAQG